MMTVTGNTAQRVLTTGLLVTVAFALSVAHAGAVSPQEALVFLNQQRAANGIPALPLDQSLLRPECTLENHHIASSAVAAWSATTSPWDHAPLHQTMLYDPNATAAAYGEFPEFKSNNPAFPSSSSPWVCMWFRWDWEVPSPTGEPTFYVFVGERGSSAVHAAETAGEYPETPGDAVGLPAGTTTGPNLLVYALGMGASPHIVSASLTSATGTPAEVRSVDGTSSYQGNPVMFPWRGDIIPVSPLAWSMSYTATAIWQSSNGTTATQDFSFTTEPAPPPATAESDGPVSWRNVGLRIVRVVRDRHSLRLTLSASKILYGRHITVVVRYLKYASHYTRSLVLRTKTVKLGLKHTGSIEVELRSPAFTVGKQRYAAASARRRINHNVN